MPKADANELAKSDTEVAGHNAVDTEVAGLADTMDSGSRPAPGSKQTRLKEERELGYGADALVGTTLNDRYEVTAKIGQGGMGAVYEAKHTLIGKRIALKVLLDKHAQNDQVVARLKQEARLASSIGHKNIIDITDFGTTECGRTFVVMEFLEGESLGACIAREGRLDGTRTLHIAKQVAGALAAAHAKGIVHRDIKPENIFLVARDGTDFVKVVDFGISKSMSEQEEDLRLTQTGMVLGTPLYMSPEQARGDEDLDHRIDIYALGVLLYESLTGEVPFQGKNYLSILTQVTSTVPKNPSEFAPEIDRDLESIVLKAMAKDRDERYQSMHAFAADLEALFDPDMKTTGARITATRWRRKKERSSSRMYAGYLAGVAIVIVGTIWGVAGLMKGTNSEVPLAPPVAHSALVPAVDAQPTPVVAKSISLTIQSSPSAAALYHGARLLCAQTPCDIELPNVDKELLLRGELEGYEDALLPITPSVDSGKALTITLKKVKTETVGTKPRGERKGRERRRGAETVSESKDVPKAKLTHDKTGELKSNPFAR